MLITTLHRGEDEDIEIPIDAGVHIDTFLDAHFTQIQGAYPTSHEAILTDIHGKQHPHDTDYYEVELVDKFKKSLTTLKIYPGGHSGIIDVERESPLISTDLMDTIPLA